VTVEGSSGEQALREDIQNIQDYLEWLYLEREVSPRYQQQTVLALIWVASFLHHQLFSSDAPRPDIRRARLRTLPINEELRRLVSKLQERARDTPRVASEEKKWIDWSEFLAVVQQLNSRVSLTPREGGEGFSTSEGCGSSALFDFRALQYYSRSTTNFQRTLCRSDTV
jgi:hypothetical protein